MKINILQTLHNYERKNVKKDILAGIIIMAVSIPISMGYAQIAGLPADCMDQYFLFSHLHFFQHRRSLFLGWMLHRQR